MKNKFLPVIPILLIIVAAGCIGQTGMNANDAFLKYTELASKTDNYKISYSTKYDLKSGAESMNFGGQMSINKQGEDSHIFYTFEDPATKNSVESNVYSINKTLYSCAWETGSAQKNCIKAGEVPQNIAPDPIQEQSQLKELLNEGAITLASEGRRSVAGYACDSISISYDIEKIREKAPNTGAGIEYMKQIQCYELETGIPLLMDVNMRIAQSGQTIETTLTATATDFSRVNAEITMPSDVRIVANPTSMFGNLTGNYSE